MDFLKRVDDSEKQEKIPHHIAETLRAFYGSYKAALESNHEKIETHLPQLFKFLECIIDQINHPFSFNHYHEKITSPFDYYHFGLNFLRPLVKLEQSSILGEEHIEEIETLLAKGDNVVLFSNHQTEPDPQAISLLLETKHPELAKNMIFIAGHRVTTDPMTVPFSKGRNLLCIYSKNYIEHPPEKKREKVHHNQKTMKVMRELFNRGGHCIFVAPSGGRDRINAEGVLEVSAFDGQNIEMFWFLSKQAEAKTHFFPLALATYDLLPPPNHIKMELGEKREPKATPIHLAFGEKINMTHFPGSDSEDKKQRRAYRAEHIWGVVKRLYKNIR